MMLIATVCWLVGMPTVAALFAFLGLSRNDVWTQEFVIVNGPFGMDDMRSSEYIAREIASAIAIGTSGCTSLYAVAMIALVVTWFATKE